MIAAIYARKSTRAGRGNYSLFGPMGLRGVRLRGARFAVNRGGKARSMASTSALIC